MQGGAAGGYGGGVGEKNPQEKNGSSGYPKGEFGTLPCAAGYGFKLQ